MKTFRIGHGYDVHRLVPGRKLMLGCVYIPHETGLLGHSDADVLCHAIADAILGAAALGDIGRHFSDSDPAYKGVSGSFILEKCMELIRLEGYEIGNVDAVVIAQQPKLAPYIPDMKEQIARALQTAPSNVNVKATTEEHLGFTGREEGIAAHAVCLLVRND